MGHAANKTLGSLLVAAGLALPVSFAQATDYYNLTGLDALNAINPGDNTSALILNGTGLGGSAFFTAGVNDPNVVGTGFLNPFIRIQQTGTGNCPTADPCIESGYNTNGQEQFQSKDQGGTKYNFAFQVGNLTQVCDVAGQGTTCFYQFVLDINELNATKTGDAFLSLDKFQIYLSGSDSLTDFVESTPDCTYPTKGNAVPDCGTDANGFAANNSPDPKLIYDIDGASIDSTIGLNYDLNSGSGLGVDMYAYVPATLFGSDLNQWVYLYSAFGATGVVSGGEINNPYTNPNSNPAGILPDGNYAHSAGFEEWATVLKKAPEPMSAALLLVGLAAISLTRRERPARIAH